MEKIQIKHNKKLFFIIIILIIFLIILIYFIVKNQKNIPDNNNNIPNNNISECEKDSDCIKVQTGCCQCSMGGEEKCIPVSELGKYTDLLKNCDTRVICTAMYACNIESCTCINSKCQPVSSTSKDELSSLV